MAKFCANCGKKLEDGQKCDCQKEEEVVTKSSAASNYFNQIIYMVKKLVKKPMNVVEDNKDESNFTLSCILICILGVVGGLFVMAVVKECVGALIGLIYGNSLYSSLYSSSNVSPDYFKMFMITFISFVGVSFLQAGVIYLIANKILKKKTTFKESTNVVGVVALLLAVFMLIATVCAFISGYLVVLFLVVGVMLATYDLVLAINHVLKIDDNKTGYVTCAMYLICTFVIYIVLRIFN